MPGDPERVKAVFLAAVEQPAVDRAAFLDRECAGDTELRQRVEALLAAHAATGNFLDRPAAELLDATVRYPPQSEDGPRSTPVRGKR